MDPSNRETIKQNEKLFRKLDVIKLRPLLEKEQIFTKSMLNDICDPDSEYDLYSELPTRGPQAFVKFLRILSEMGYQDEVDTLAQPSKNKIVENGKKYQKCEYYSMQLKPVGYCLIINNMKFEIIKEDKKEGDKEYKKEGNKEDKKEGDKEDKKEGDKVNKKEGDKEEELEFRYGSEVDVKNLRTLFEKLGYVIEEYTNLKANKIKRCLENLSKNQTLKSINCCFIVILSHGSNIRNIDVVYGSDGVAVEKQEIIDIFNNNNCENLRRKPKIFIFQACRGEKEDEGVYSMESSDSVKTTKIPCQTDMLVIHPTLPKHKAYRNHFYGSWLIQDLVSVFSEDYQYKDLELMLREVNKKMEKRFSKHDNKQVLHIENYYFIAGFYICSDEEFKGCDMALRSYV